MTPFEQLFGVKPGAIRKNCLLSPFLPDRILAEFNVRDFKHDKLYGTGSTKDFTLIRTGLGAPLVGDAVLYLRDTPCKRIVLFGSCGLTHSHNSLGIGSLVTPAKAGSDESFTGMLLSKGRKITNHYPDRALLRVLHDRSPKDSVKDVTCRTVASLKLESDELGILIKDEVAIVDMECSALFAAAKHVSIPAVALFYVSDIINERPFYTKRTADEKAALGFALNRSFEILWSILTENA